MNGAASSIAALRRRSALERALGKGVAAALEADEVVEALINEDGVVWIDCIGRGLMRTEHVLCAHDREAAIRLIAHEAGVSIGEDRPQLAAILPEIAARVQAMLPPLTRAPVLAIRKRPRLMYRLDDYVKDGVATRALVEQLKSAIAAKQNIIVAGGTGSGKTTLLNALLAEPAFTQSRVVILEDTAELQCVSPNSVQLLTKTSAPAIGMRELVQMTLRLRPDRIVVGEVRDGAALEVLKAWNTGHPGGLLTLHANSAADAMARLEDLCMEARAQPPKRLIETSVDMLVFIARTARGRAITDIINCREAKRRAR